MSNPKIGPWTVHSAADAFDNPWINVTDHKVTHPNGEAGQYSVVRFKNLAVGVLPIDQNGDVWLVGQHRFPHDRYSWELPEGGAPLAEDPLEAAKRELAEETGLHAKEWSELTRFDLSNSVTDERAIGFLAWGLSQGEASPEASEELTIKRVSFRTLFEMVLKGEVRDSLTIVMTLTAHAKALRGDVPQPICGHILAATGQT
ncbi:MAG: DNA mismatch repair protein MutT [Hyphococcus sp.]|nr:MAG: DNA mismatch repair protein MutT [Marinicaulis sp.]